MQYLIFFLLSLPLSLQAKSDFDREADLIEAELSEYEQIDLSDKSRFRNHFKFQCSISFDLRGAEREPNVDRNGNIYYYSTFYEIDDLNFEPMTTRDLYTRIGSISETKRLMIERSGFIFKLGSQLVSRNYDIGRRYELNVELSVHKNDRSRNKKKTSPFVYAVDVTKAKLNTFSLKFPKRIKLEDGKSLGIKLNCQRLRSR